MRCRKLNEDNAAGEAAIKVDAVAVADFLQGQFQQDCIKPELDFQVRCPQAGRATASPLPLTCRDTLFPLRSDIFAASRRQLRLWEGIPFWTLTAPGTGRDVIWPCACASNALLGC